MPSFSHGINRCDREEKNGKKREIREEIEDRGAG
jgi:hypothetical protein